MSTAYPLVSRVVFGAGETAVEVDRLSGGLGLSAKVDPARMPVEVYDGFGDLQLISGPGADRVRVSIAGAGRAVPSLAGLSLGSLATVIYWPNGTTTSLTLTTAGIATRGTDLSGAVTDWRLEGVGLVTRGADPLGR